MLTRHLNKPYSLTEKITFSKYAGAEVAGKATVQKNGKIQEALKGKKITQEIKITKTLGWVTLPLKVTFKF